MNANCSEACAVLAAIVAVLLVVGLVVLAVVFLCKCKYRIKILSVKQNLEEQTAAIEPRAEDKAMEDKLKVKDYFPKTHDFIENASDDTSQSDSDSVEEQESKIRIIKPPRPTTRIFHQGDEVIYAPDDWFEVTDEILSSIRSRKKRSELTYNLTSVLATKRLVKKRESYV